MPDNVAPGGVAPGRSKLGRLRHFANGLSCRNIRAALVLSIIGISALFLGLSVFAYPSADDFCFAVKTNQLGFGGAQAYWFDNWTGRFASTAAISGFVAGGDIVESYRFAAIAMLLLTFFSFAFLLWSINHDHFPRRTVLLAAGVLTVLFVSVTPDPAQTFYWLSGSFTYQLGNVFVRCFSHS